MTSNINNKCSIEKEIEPLPEELKKELKDEPQAFKLNYENAVTLINFYKIFKDLIIDLKNSFNDKVGFVIDNNKDYQKIMHYSLPNYKEKTNADEYINSIDLSNIDITFMISLNNVYEYCKHTFAVRSIDILYQNEDIFLNKKNVKATNNSTISTMFLPDIEFSDLYYDDTSEQTKQTLWKYLQLILFNIITSIDDPSFFGDSLELLKIIDSANFSAKIQSTVEELSNIFSFKKNKGSKTSQYERDCEDKEGDNKEGDIEEGDSEEGDDKEGDDKEGDGPNMSSFFDISQNPFNMFQDMFDDLSGNFRESNNASQNDYNIPDKEELFAHMNNLINGKIGSLAKEIAEETAKDFDLETENISDVNDMLKGFMKNPTKMLGLIDNINKKINSKMKDGSIKESELLEEATALFKNMKNMPGMNNFNDILKSMNLDKFMPKGGKINPNTFQNMMEQNVKMSKMKERMKKKAENNKHGTSTGTTTNKDDLQNITANLSSLMEQMQSNTSFIDDIIKKEQHNVGTNVNTARSNDDNSKRSSNNKKKANKKK